MAYGNLNEAARPLQAQKQYKVANTRGKVSPAGIFLSLIKFTVRKKGAALT
jgi:hypothetical protein